MASQSFQASQALYEDEYADAADSGLLTAGEAYSADSAASFAQLVPVPELAVVAERQAYGGDHLVSLAAVEAEVVL